MPTFAFYLLKVILCASLLFGYYHLFLRNKIYHSYNRFYLLATVAISIVSPLINFSYFFSFNSGKTVPIQLIQSVTNADEYLEGITAYSQQNNITLSQILLFVYLLFCVVLLAIFIQLLLQIISLLKNNSSKKINDVIFIESNAKGTPFSFFKYIFWNNAIDLHTETGQRIFAHELAHVREKHSMDKLFINLVLIFYWINPIFWLIKKELNLIHEFIADKKAVANNDASTLAAMIVTSAYPKHTYLLGNHFFYSPIKRRLQMLSKYNTKKTGYFYRILALPVVLILMLAFTIKTKENINYFSNNDKKITVLIDAGHGGKDFGAKGINNIAEKDINLAFIKKIKSVNSNPNINLVFTREEDIYQNPNEKVTYLEKYGADLLISIHTDAVQNNSDATSNINKEDFKVFVSKDQYSNSNSSKILASAIINVFKTNYGIPVSNHPQQREVGIRVIQVDIPAVLIQIGDITNKQELTYLQTDEAQETFAKNILTAISQFAENSNQTPATALTSFTNITDTTELPKNNFGTYKGQKIKQIKVTDDGTNVVLILANGEVAKMKMADAEKQHILIPPPPPPPAPPVPPSPPAPPAPPAEKANLDAYRKTDASERVVIINNEKVVNLERSTNPVNVASTQPIYMLDGIEIPAYKLKELDPDCIESVNVLKGESALKKNEKAINGIVEIKTKKGAIYKKNTDNGIPSVQLNKS